MSGASNPATNFCDLPTEIRREIWKFCCSEERILHFKVDANVRLQKFDTYCLQYLPPPKFLRSWSSKENEQNDEAAGCSIPGCWWNPSMDIIYVPYWLPIHSKDNPNLNPGVKDMSFPLDNPFFQKRMSAMQHLAVSTKATGIRWIWEESIRHHEPFCWLKLASWIAEFPNLKTFTYVVDYYTYRYKEQGPRWIDHPDFAIEGNWRSHSARWDMTPSKIIAELEECFERIRSERGDANWKPPRVRIVLDEEDQEECYSREARLRRKNPGSYEHGAATVDVAVGS
ncbi:hypothetical protein BOTNAR_0248g00020 [Botryotinia narcissicola]|uniref:2EXR domain-containing protein n=1 Tax=Botryotinia narcissicola TaxID=278944 RepID=A0A4Z1IF53_9HELO|nr:hypothetical protein BOTNAR_0248g00020 [Botryotinia narcissicola]